MVAINRSESLLGGRYEMAEMTITARPAWQARDAHFRVIRDRHLRELFAKNPKRGERMDAEAAGIIWIIRRTASPTRRCG